MFTDLRHCVNQVNYNSDGVHWKNKPPSFLFRWLPVELQLVSSFQLPLEDPDGDRPDIMIKATYHSVLRLGSQIFK